MKIIIPVICLLLTIGCGVQTAIVHKDWTVSTGSRSDGTMTLFYTYNSFERPVTNSSQATELATTKCVRWGYANAEAFGSVLTKCTSFAADHCYETFVSMEFQCISNENNKTIQNKIPDNVNNIKPIIDRYPIGRVILQ